MDIDHIFKYHAPDEKKQLKYNVIRETAKSLARVIETEVPDCADRTAAIRLLRECVMTANAAIALDGRL